MPRHGRPRSDLPSRPTHRLALGVALLLGLLQVSCGWEELFSRQEVVPPPESTYTSSTGVLQHEVGETQEVQLARVTPKFFEVLGGAWLGRVIIPRDCEEGAAPVVVLSHALWTEDFSGSPEVLGRDVALDGRVHEVIGVMPEGIDWPLDVQLWVPRTVQPEAI